ncbi:MAG: DUF6782 family putative metallopeptidase [Pseudomonadota bacterium]
MGKKTDNNKNRASYLGVQSKRRRIRMAYTLNNTQPVQCTIVSDQPFFYIDEDSALEEDLFFEDDVSADISIDPYLEAHLLDMQKKSDLYDRVREDSKENYSDSLASFHDESELFSSFSHECKTSLKAVQDILGQSRFAQTMLEDARKDKIDISHSKEVIDARFDQEAGKILIHPALHIYDQVLLLSRELKRARHNRDGYIAPLSYHPDHAILINRIAQADLCVAMVRTAWELKLNGHHDVWARIEKSSYQDLGRALAREALTDFRTLNNGKAHAVAFECWFLSERCHEADKGMINAMLSSYEDYVIPEKESEGTSVMKIIARIGDIPLGKNYLAPHALVIMEDALFSEVRDRANANFLWFIKFERSFKETERQLQSHGDLQPSIHDGHNYNSKDTIDENYQSARGGDFATGEFDTDIRGQNPTGGNNIIYLSFGHPQSDNARG